MSQWILNEDSVSYGSNKLLTTVIDRTKSGSENLFNFIPFYLPDIGESQKNKKKLFTQYANLHHKLSSISKLRPNWDNEGALSISQTAIHISRDLVDMFEEMELVEKNIYIHIFPAFNGEIQFELDGLLIKADIEISSDDRITLTKYSGETNKVTELFFTKNNLQDLKNNLL